MAREFSVVQADDGGYLVKSMDPQKGVYLKVRTNFGAVVKEARAFFDEQKEKTKEETPE